MKQNTKSSVVINRLDEVGCLPLPVQVHQKINDIFSAALRKAEVELAAEMFDKKSVTRIFREVMCPATRGDVLPAEVPPPLPNSGTSEGGGGAA